MLLQNFGDQIIERAKLTIPKEFLGWSVVIQMANYGIQSVYPLALKQCKWYYQKSLAFTATGNVVTKPTDCQELLSVAIPGTTQGHATPIDVRQYNASQSATITAGSPKNPVFREDKLSIYLNPYRDLTNTPFSGVFHYLRNIAMVTDETFEISLPNANALPLIPWFYEEDAIMEALRMIRIRARKIIETPNSVEQLLAVHDDMMAKLRAGSDPLVVYRATLPGPLK